MPNEKLEYYVKMAEDTARRITWNQDNWTAFLRTAARLYKYPFQEQLLIFAQRPGATACADYDTWNTRMRRYVKRGGHGIALIDESGGYPRLKHVFDITDTGTGPNSLTPYLWNLQPEHFRTVSDALAQRFGMVAKDGIDAVSSAADVLTSQIQDIFSIQAAEFYENNSLDILRSVDNSHLAGYDEDEIRSAFLQAATESGTYMSVHRCGLHSAPEFNPAVFHRIAEFNTPDAIGELGRAVNECGAQVLRTIEGAVKSYERERRIGAERSVNYDRTEEGAEVRSGVLRGADQENGSHDRPGERSELSPGGRGLDPGYRAGAGADAGRAPHLPLGNSAAGLSEETSSESVSAIRSSRDALDAHEGRAGTGTGAPGSDDPGDGEGPGRDGGAESQGSNEMGRDDEQHPGQRGGDDLRGADLRISEPAPGEQLGLFPTEAEQLQIIQEAESAQAAPFASSIPQEVIDDFLRHGSNTTKSRMHIIASLYPWYSPDTAWITENAREALTGVLRREYHGGYGLVVDGIKYAAWYDDGGIRISHGTSARYSPFAQTVSWNDALERIWRLYGDGQFATNVEAEETHGNECREIALALLYLYYDRSENCPDKYLSSIRPYVSGGRPDEQARLAEALRDANEAFEIKNDLDTFIAAYMDDHSLLRFHYHKINQLQARFASLFVSWDHAIPQTAQELPHTPFITEDEIDEAVSSRGSGFEGGRQRVYNYFTSLHDPKDKSDFLKDEYGTGGHSHALSGADNSWEDHDAKGLRFKKGDCPEVTISWVNLAKRIETLIRMNRFLPQAQQAAVGVSQAAPAEPAENIEAAHVEAAQAATSRKEAVLVGKEESTLYLYSPEGLSADTRLEGGQRQPEDAVVIAAPSAALSEDFLFAHDMIFLKIGRDISPDALSGAPGDQLAAMKQAAASRHSELWETYMSAKRELPDGIVLLRVGDHYEILGDAAGKAAEVLQLPLASRFTLDGRLPMCSVSQPLLQESIQKLNSRWNVSTVDYKDENHEERTVERYLSPLANLQTEKKTGRTRVERNYKTFARLFPEILNGEYRYLQLRTPTDDGMMPLTIERIGSNEISISHFYTQNGDLMYDPEMTFRLDTEKGTLEPLTFRQDGSPALYQEVYPAPGKWIPKLRNDLSAFTEKWFKNIEAQGRVRFRAVAERDGEDVEYAFDENGQPTLITPQTEPIASELPNEQPVQPASQAERYTAWQQIKESDTFIADGILLSHFGVAFEAYGEDADRIAELYGAARVDFELADLGGPEKVTFTAIPEFKLNEAIEALRDKYDVAVVSGDSVKRYLSIDHEADKAIDAHEAEFGADGWRAFGGKPMIPEEAPAEAPTLREMTQEEIDDALRAWNGREDSRNAVMKYMAAHGRERGAAEWLKNEFISHSPEAFDRARLENGLTLITPTGDAETVLPWQKVQLRIAQLIRDGSFLPAAEAPAQLPEAAQSRWPVDIGNTLYLEDGKAFLVEQLTDNHITLRDPTLIYPILRSESYESFRRLLERFPQPGVTENVPVPTQTQEITYIPIAVNDETSGDVPDLVMQTVTSGELQEPIRVQPENFRITDEYLGEGGPKAKFRANMDAITTLKRIEAESRNATPEEQEILSRYVGWGGVADAFDDRKAEWSKEFAELKETLTPEEYAAARSSTLNAHYTSPTVIRSIYEALGNMGFTTGNILEPACGVGNFFGCLPSEMSDSRLYGVELDSISGRIAKLLYPNANITVAGFETTDRKDFYDLAVGNVPFGQYQVNDRAYNKLGFSIHNYFFAKALDQVRPGGIVAFVTSRYTMDAKDDSVRRYLAQRAELLGAIRLPNNAFRANAGTDVVSDIIFLQKRAKPSLEEPEWISTAKNIPDSAPAKVGDVITFTTGYPPQEYTAEVIEVSAGYANTLNYRAKNEEREFSYISPANVSRIERKDFVYEINQYFLDHPEMVLGVPTSESTQYGRMDYTVAPVPGAKLSVLLQDAVKNVGGLYRPPELIDLADGAELADAIPADPSVRNYSYTLVGGELYFRSGSVMIPAQETGTAKDRIKAMIGLRDCLRRTIEHQLDAGVSEDVLDRDRIALNRLYDAFTMKYGLINSKSNRAAFEADSSYYLMTSLEKLDEDGNLAGKADIFFRRTIKQQRSVDRVDTPSEALAVSIGQKAEVDLAFMAQLLGGPDHVREIVTDLQGVIFKDPASGPFDLDEGGEHWDQGWQPADEYLSGNVRKKLREAEQAAQADPFFQVNAEALRRAQPKDLDASEIDVRIGSTWIDPEYYRQFMFETFKTSQWQRRKVTIQFSPYTGAWKIEGIDKYERTGFQVTQNWGTDRKNAYDIFEDSLNLREVTVYDSIEENGKERRILNREETTLAAQKQERMRSEFRDWIWKDPERREALVKKYNEEMNSTRPREYDGKHLVFSGINPEIELREHQLNAIAHAIYGGNTLLAHEVGAGKTFEMVATAMESKRLGLCNKSLFVVPNHLVDQWASEFLRLYPAANILVTTKKDFQPKNRKRFCSRIATGDYDAVIIGQTQFERIPISKERQIRLIQTQINDLTGAIDEMESDYNHSRWSVKQMEKFKTQLEARLQKLQDAPRDDAVTFEELGVDRLFVDESDYYKNLYTYTKMQNVAGISNSSAQKSQDLFYKCRYMDEITGGRGLIFATGTPVSNSMTEVYIIQQYLQYERMQELGMGIFDAWASRFGETTSQMELAPEGSGYRLRNRFAKFFNLPELMTLFKEVADIKTADQLDLPTPEVEYHNCVAKPTELQKSMMQSLSERASRVHNGAVDPKEDNMLKITSDGRKLGLDQRIVNPMLPDEPGTKVNMCVENVLRIWREGDADKLTQLVFCDFSTPKAKQRKKPAAAKPEDAPEPSSPDFVPSLEESADNGFSIYDDIRAKLIAGGMPPEQIAFIHDADTEAKKRELFDKMRKGSVRVLLGSTAKMGAGTNVQDRLIASHDLDCRATRS